MTIRPSLVQVQPITYSLTEAAALIPCGERWLTDRLRNGTFRARKIAGKWRLTQGDIDNIVAQCLASTEKVTPTPARESLASYRRANAK